MKLKELKTIPLGGSNSSFFLDSLEPRRAAKARNILHSSFISVPSSRSRCKFRVASAYCRLSILDIAPPPITFTSVMKSVADATEEVSNSMRITKKLFLCNFKIDVSLVFIFLIILYLFSFSVELTVVVGEVVVPGERTFGLAD